MFFLDDYVVQNDTNDMKTLSVEVKYRCTELSHLRQTPTVGGCAISLFEVDQVLGTLLCGLLNPRLNGKIPNDLEEALLAAFGIDIPTVGSMLNRIKRAIQLGDSITFLTHTGTTFSLQAGG
jgi:hypothetical protein